MHKCIVSVVLSILGVGLSVAAASAPTYESVPAVYTSGPNVGKPVVIPAVTHYGEAPFYRGINLSGLEYDGRFEDALAERPDLPDARYFVMQGMNFIRLPVRAEFMVPNPDDPQNLVNAVYMNAVYDTVQKYLQAGLTVDLELHDNLRFCASNGGLGAVGDPADPLVNRCQILTAAQLAHIWTLILKAELIVPGLSGTQSFTTLAQQYPTQLMFGIMNAPFDDSPSQPLSTGDVFTAEVAAAKAIRGLAPKNVIIFSGNDWSLLRSWMSVESGNSNTFTASALTAAGLNLSNVAVGVNQFFDWTYRGQSQICNHYDDYLAFQQDMGLLDGAGKDIFGAWMVQNHMPVFLTAFGGAATLADGSANVDCRQDLAWMLQYVDTHAYDNAHPEQGGFVGWALWHANRHNRGPVSFDFLQAADPEVYGSTGIAQGSANALMADLIAKYLVPPK
jgi:hypothetical protein